MMAEEREILSYGSKLRLNVKARKLFVKDKVIYLRNKEYTLLEFFMRNCGRVVTRTTILEEVWDRNITCPTNTIDVHVSTLRRKLKKYLNGDPIKTVHCIGYFFGD